LKSQSKLPSAIKVPARHATGHQSASALLPPAIKATRVTSNSHQSDQRPSLINAGGISIFLHQKNKKNSDFSIDIVTLKPYNKEDD